MLTTGSAEDGFLLCDDPTAFVAWPLLSGQLTGHQIVYAGEGARAMSGDPIARRHGYLSFVGFPVLVWDKPAGVIFIYDRDRLLLCDEDLETLATLARTLQIEEERLEREESLRNFIDIASHELRHPVTIIKGYAITLREHLGDMPEKQVREMLSAIDEGSKRITRLVELLLDTSRMEHGLLRLELQETDLLCLLSQAVEEMCGRGGKVVLRAEGDIGACRLDRDRILEVCIILLENALKFSPPEIVVEVEAVPLQGGCMVSVMDRGQGIPPEEGERVFDRFHQVEQARFHSKPGMGMGLYIAREIVESHGGRIWFEPRPGGGSIFRFTLPG